jgi:hypothetical protein
MTELILPDKTITNDKNIHTDLVTNRTEAIANLSIHQEGN